MSIRRSTIRPAAHYAIISNGFLRDTRLSLKARGLGAYLLSHADTFRSTVASLAKANGCGTDQIKTALHELEDHGYLRREQFRDDHGRLLEVDYAITDEPRAGKPAPAVNETPAHDETGPGKPASGKPASGQPRQRETPPHKKTKGLEDQLAEQPPNLPSAPASADQQAQLTLDGTPAPAPVSRAKFSSKSARKPKTEQPTRANEVVDGWIVAYRTTGVEPTKRHISAVGRSARELLLAGNDFDRILTAARSAGARGYTTIDRELAQQATTVAARNGHRPFVDTRSEDDYSGALR